MSAAVLAASWPLARAGEALELLGRRSGCQPDPGRVMLPPPDLAARGSAEVGRWIEGAARWLGLQAEPVETSYAEVDALIAGAGPALLLLPGDEPRLLVIAAARSGSLRVIGPDHAPRRVAADQVRALLCARLEAPLHEAVERMLDAAGLAARRRPHARRQLLRQLIAAHRIGGCWLVRPALAAGAGEHLGRARLLGRAAALLGSHGLQYGVFIGSWWLLGWMTLGDRLEQDLLLLWLLLVCSIIPLRFLSTYVAGQLSIDLGAFLKRRLLAGVLRLEPDEIRHLGVGQLLGRTLEIEAIEQFSNSGALLGITALVELALIVLVLGAGVGGAPHALLLVAWTLLLCWLGVSYHRRRTDWTESRLEITNQLVEQMVGHQTRVAQEPREHWNLREDQALDRYLGRSGAMDRLATGVEAGIARGWLIVGLLGLAPAFVAGTPSAGALGASLGGVLLAYRSLRWLSLGLEQLSAAAIAWRRAHLFRTAVRRPERIGPPQFALAASPDNAGDGVRRPLLEVHGLRFRHAGREEPVVQDLHLRIFTGDRLVLEGPSGGGKSTLAALLSASRVPDSGLLLLDGLDPATLGDAAWRRRVVFVPQFHENHVLIGTFAFNVLMGRGWPAPQEDLDRAEAVCRGLGLGPLLDRMPSGMLQMVGETGWQLSHGERSRLFIARAVVQDPDLIILDESFAALDPETLSTVVGYLQERDAAILAIAHP